MTPLNIAAIQPKSKQRLKNTNHKTNSRCTFHDVQLSFPYKRTQKAGNTI